MSGAHEHPTPHRHLPSPPARVWNYWLGGEDNYSADREAGDRIVAVLPEIVGVALATRAVLVRMINHLAERGIDQFLDIGTGLPTANNTHEVAQIANPAARIVYVDNDPLGPRPRARPTRRGR